MWKNRIIGHESHEAGWFVANPKNWRIHPAAQGEAVEGALESVGWVRSVLVNQRTGYILDGHLRITLALRQGEDTIVPVEIVDLSEEEEALVLAHLDSVVPMAGRDAEKLGALLAQCATSKELPENEKIDEFLKTLATQMPSAKPTGEDPGAQIDGAEELREKWGVESGQLWQLGEHRLICGDCTDARLVGRLLENGQVDVIVTDPPYCSGGFQEAGRSAGSIGTLNPQKIVNDRLSTRGYTALLEYALHAVRAESIYIFTDWRMWSHLYDLSEANGYGVRSMIVWNKKSAGMGYGWRSQHELVLFASKDTPKFDLHKSRGNVIEESRTGNKNHATEKPVELIEELLGVSDFCETVYDPFAGSGTTLIACERLGRKCRAVEITPTYCAVAIQRWVDMTGGEPKILTP